MEIYLDLVMALNFMVDFLLLLGTNRLSGFPAQPWRCAWAALLGAVYSGACLLPGFSFLGNLFWRGISLCLMGTIAYGIHFAALKRGALFLLLSLAMAGIALHMGQENLLSVVLCVLLCLLLCMIGFGGQAGGQEFLPLQIALGDKSASLIALRDTGNTLRDPMTGEPVIVISASVAGRLTGLTQQQLQNPLETLSSSILPGLRLIPYHTIGNAGGFMLAKRFEDVVIAGKRKSTLVAFAAEGLGNGEIYQALTGGY